MYYGDPAAWVAKYLLGAKFKFSPAANGGLLVERGIVEALKGRELSLAIDDALADYNKATMFDKSDKVQKWAEAMHDMIFNGYNELSGLGKPIWEVTGDQRRIEISCNMGDYKMPIVGYLDLVFPDCKKVVDIKCTQRMPSEMSVSHKRQAAIYKQAMPEYAVEFLYLTPKKTQWFQIEDVAGDLADIKTIIHRMNSLLGVGDANTIKEIVPVVDSFYFNDDLALRKELYGI
jgi:ABC-type amino acid transport substrate-binding protein